MTTTHPDVIVIGGGPTGSTAAAVLAMHGRRVLLLEKERFPRYHIGESLMPHTYFPLQRIGVLDKMQRSKFVKKHSVQFVRRTGQVTSPFYFGRYRDHPSSQTWQVLRSEFDQMLLDNARDKGAEVIEGMAVRETITGAHGATVGVRAAGDDGREHEFRAPMTIDASGRDAFTAIRNGWRVRDEKLDKIALWTYYRGALRDPGIDEGATTVAYMPDKGWFWYIPLHDDVVSAGVVAERDYLFRDTRNFEEIWRREIKVNAWIDKHLAAGQQFGPYRTTGEYTYRSRHSAADGLVLAGDAFGFLDPIFSSGVLLALKSGELAADAVHAALGAGDVSASRFEDYARTVCDGVENMRKLVYAFYDHAFSWRKVIDHEEALRSDITDCLIGDLFARNYDHLFEAVAKFAALPPPVPLGRPHARIA